MTGASAATGYSLQHVHTAIEITVLAVGWLLGWTMGIDTVPASRWRSARIQFALRRSTERAVGEERRLQGFVSDGSMLRKRLYMKIRSLLGRFISAPPSRLDRAPQSVMTAS